MSLTIKHWLLTAACALVACLPLSGQAQPYFANKQGDQIWDKATSLVWQRCSVGQIWDGATCTETPQKFTFDQAKNQGGDGWRVPTIRELASLVYCSSGKKENESDPKDGGPVIAEKCAGVYSSPTINTVAFPATPANFFWSSSPYVGDSGYAWFVLFGDGYVGNGNRSSSSRVRLVSASQLSGSEAALAFPVSLAAKSRQVQAQDHARAVREAQEAQRRAEREAQEAARRAERAAATACSNLYVGKPVGVRVPEYLFGPKRPLDAVITGIGNGRASYKIVDSIYTSHFGQTGEMSCSAY